MIVNFPTAFFASALPHKPSDDNNVTWLCSGAPPRPTLDFNQALMLVLERSLPAKINDMSRRQSRGDLIFTISRGVQAVLSSNVKQYEPGQVVDFGSVNVPLLQTVQIGELQTRHDTNNLDLSKTGLDDSEVVAVSMAADSAQRQAIANLNNYQQQYADNIAQITNLQLAINEATKALSAVSAIIAIQPGTETSAIYAKLSATIASLIEQQQALIAKNTQLVADIGTANGDLLAISQLVR